MLLGLGAGGASAQVLQLQGSDTLFELLNDPTNGILANCPAANPLIDYAGGGSSNGETSTEGDLQEIAPMSRFLDAAACSHNPAANAGCFEHSLDGLAAVAHESAAENCTNLRWSGTMNLPSGGTYTFANWRTVLRIIYGGQSGQAASITGHDPCSAAAPARSPIAEKDCGSEVRRTLVDTWSNMFEGGCTNSSCGALKHAFRRDDVSGTTDTFLELLALPAITSTPFCNGTETQDNDPIRRQCTGNGHTNGEQVCKGSNPATPTTTSQGLGLVLPSVIPQVDPYAGAPTQLCSNAGFGGAAFGDVSMPFGTTVCPNGAALVAGTCKWPRRTGTASGNFNCIASANDRPAGTPASVDARVYNLTLRSSAGTIINYQRRTSAGAIQNLPMTSAYYRIHQNRGMPGTTLAANTGCALLDSTEQIGCLVEASPCSIGFSGLTAINDPATAAPDANRKGLGLRSAVNSGAGAAIMPTDANVRLLLEDSCPGTLATGDQGFEDRYPFSRGLWLCSVDGFGPPWTTTGSQTAGQLDAQAALTSCFQNRTVIDQAANAAGFVTLPAGPVPFVACP